MGELAKLPNIGSVVEEQLISVGIETPEALQAAGAEGAWLKIRAVDASACIHRLYALEGAISGVRKSDLSAQRKAELKQFYNQYK